MNNSLKLRNKIKEKNLSIKESNKLRDKLNQDFENIKNNISSLNSIKTSIKNLLIKMK